MVGMARTSTTADVFNAIGDVGRRSILTTLGGDELSVGEMVARLGLSQPTVSKHLKVLRKVDLVHCRIDGRQRHYRVNAVALRPVHDLVAPFEAMWNDRYDRLEDLLRELGNESVRRPSPEPVGTPVGEQPSRPVYGPDPKGTIA